jgi:hypothetical protein
VVEERPLGEAASIAAGLHIRQEGTTIKLQMRNVDTRSFSYNKKVIFNKEKYRYVILIIMRSLITDETLND